MFCTQLHVNTIYRATHLVSRRRPRVYDRIAHLYLVPSFFSFLLSLCSCSVNLTLYFFFLSSLFLHLFPPPFFFIISPVGDDILKMKPKLIKHILPEQKCKHRFKACCWLVRARCAGMSVVEGGYFRFCSECWDASVSETCPTFPRQI